LSIGAGACIAERGAFFIGGGAMIVRGAAALGRRAVLSIDRGAILVGRGAMFVDEGGMSNETTGLSRREGAISIRPGAKLAVGGASQEDTVAFLDRTELVGRARTALRMTQNELAEKLGASRRTGQRWAAGASTPSDRQLAELAALVCPRDRPLASDLAREARTSLEELGLAEPQRPVQAPRPMPSDALLADSVVCAAVEASMLPPAVLRTILLASLARARELGMDLARLEAALERAKPEAG
jgi:transcriptional regulator with XRE-family HTH domain